MGRLVLGGIGLQNFEFEPETLAYCNTFSSTPLRGEIYTYDRFIKRLKNYDIYDNIIAGWILRQDTEHNSLVDFITPSRVATKTSTPTFTAYNGWQTNTAGQYIDLGFNPSLDGVNNASFHVSMYSGTNTLSVNSDGGAFDGLFRGITVSMGATSNTIVIRANGAAQASTAGYADGSGLVTATCDGTTLFIYLNGQLVSSHAYTVFSPINANLRLLISNGGTNPTNRSLGYFDVGTFLTADEVKKHYACVQTLMDSVQGGYLNIYESGYAPQNLEYDLIIYGAGLAGVLAAREASRQGLSVAIVGSWRETNIGGMTTGGISVADLQTLAAYGGLPRLFITRVNQYYTRPDTSFTFQPRIANIVLRGFLDSTRADGAAIPIYWSTGVASVSMTGTELNSFTTFDGRTFSAEDFVDASYEGDLMALSGCTYIVGREAAGSGYEAQSGERGTQLTFGGTTNQFKLLTVLKNVDPYLTPGSSSSGVIYPLLAAPTVPDGTADSHIMDYSFRINVSNALGYRQTQPATSPDGYSAANYEALVRFFKVLTDEGDVFGVDWNIDSILYFQPVETGVLYDINQAIAIGPNFSGQSWSYPEATNTARETLWQNHANWVRGMWYTISYGRSLGGDPRIPAALETAAQGYGIDRRQWNDPHPNDELWWPYQLYVREARRMVGPFIYTSNDLGAVDGTTPRSTKTIGCLSYFIDSHHVQAFADPNGGTPRVWATGMWVNNVLGANQYTPIPIECILPSSSECTNLAVIGSMSMTHGAFSGARMEMTYAACAQGAAVAVAVAQQTGAASLQAVNYTTVRSELLASPSLSGEVAPVIPQLN